MAKNILILIVLLLVMVGTVSAQTGYLPTIDYFEADIETVSLADVEGGTAVTTLQWRVLNMRASDRLVLDSYQINTPFEIYTGLPAEGSVELALINPLNFSRPTFTLRIVAENGDEIARQSVVFYYEEPDETPTISTFNADAGVLSRNQLRLGNVLVNVNWEVVNRIPYSNLEFEQVLTDGSGINVELPRPNRWVSSEGAGVVRPRLDPQNADEVTLRLRVVEATNRPDKTVYDEALVTLPVVLAPPPTVGPTQQPYPTPTFPPQLNVSLNYFEVEPKIANPGDTVTVRWDVSGSVTDLHIVDSYEGLKVTGYPIHGEEPIGSSGSLTYQLPTTTVPEVELGISVPEPGNEWGRIYLGSTTVQLTCPYAPAFEIVVQKEEGDKCPHSAPKQVNAAYQRFENGHMIYLEDTGGIWVLRDDGTGTYHNQSNYASIPDPDPSIVPPEGRYVPERGFGKVWNISYQYNGELGDIGWATTQESGYTTYLQDYTNGPYTYRLYVTLPDGAVVRIGGMGSWYYVR